MDLLLSHGYKDIVTAALWVPSLESDSAALRHQRRVFGVRTGTHNGSNGGSQVTSEGSAVSGTQALGDNR